MNDDDDDTGVQLCCPECGVIQDEFEVYTHSANHDRCVACREEIAEDDWVRD